ncbi:hypothetical protein Ahy_A10g049742 [Arachis hypogaea]|uniref:Uncharacterized protein n=1 Tax=Arachis hypogaea TaxID=3818 RepID=A0A445B7T8_ARAHY|nr:hypothetical protein Ahy_A10g049742 [Arachis hypogaea]
MSTDAPGPSVPYLDPFPHVLKADEQFVSANIRNGNSFRMAPDTQKSCSTGHMYYCAKEKEAKEKSMHKEVRSTRKGVNNKQSFILLKPLLQSWTSEVRLISLLFCEDLSLKSIPKLFNKFWILRLCQVVKRISLMKKILTFSKVENVSYVQLLIGSGNSMLPQRGMLEAPRMASKGA